MSSPTQPTTGELALGTLREGHAGYDACSGLLGRLLPAWIGLARRLLADRPQDADDVVQDVGLWVIENRSRLPDFASLRGYTLRMVRYMCAKVLRSKGISREEPRVEPPDPAPGARTGFWGREREERLRALVGGLPEEVRAVAELALSREMTVQRMAEALDRPRSSVHHRLQQIRDRVRTELGDEVPPSARARS